jgi:hypothetical protein
MDVGQIDTDRREQRHRADPSPSDLPRQHGRLYPTIITLPQPDAARRGQKTPDGYYNLERMLKRATAPPNRVLLCGTCMDARGLGDADVVEGAANSTMEELASETLAADRTVVF